MRRGLLGACGGLISARFLWEEQAGRCWYCKKPVQSRKATVDHVLAKSRGGTNDWSNLVVACLKCNRRKGNRRTHRVKTLGRLNALRAMSGAQALTAADVGDVAPHRTATRCAAPREHGAVQGPVRA